MQKKQAWIVSVDMGYGHQRAAYPLKDIAYDRIITANSDKIVSPEEADQWRKFRLFYEGISRIRSIPLIGETLWKMFDYIQSITPYYPFRDLSTPNLASKVLHWYITKGFLKSLVDHTDDRKPMVATFFAPALAAAYHGRKNVYCVATDTDINRVWAPAYPSKSGKNRLYYFSPTEEATTRLIEYGVPQEDIFFTGFPLPKENTGKNMDILRRDFSYRLPNLDPNKVIFSRYKEVINKIMGREYKHRSNHPLTLTFAVGGAGAQSEIGVAMLESLKDAILQHRIKVHIIAGTRLEVEQFFKKKIVELKLSKEFGKYVSVFCALDKAEHFKGFDNILHTTDILWTKPSELSFYCALGIPLIIAPPLGSQEIFNKKWLTMMGSGIPQENPKYTKEWLFDWIEKGRLADAAWQGFMEGPKYGTYNIEKVLFSKSKKNIKFRY
jgi:hypothetical protein